MSKYLTLYHEEKMNIKNISVTNKPLATDNLHKFYGNAADLRFVTPIKEEAYLFDEDCSSLYDVIGFVHVAARPKKKSVKGDVFLSTSICNARVVEVAYLGEETFAFLINKDYVNDRLYLVRRDRISYFL